MNTETAVADAASPPMTTAGSSVPVEASGPASTQQPRAGAPAESSDAGEEPHEPAPTPDAGATTEKPHEPPEWPSDCETRHAFLAHGTASPNDPSKYVVPPGAQYYRLFYFVRPWTDDAQILKVRSIVDNAKIVHHWTLYTVTDDSARDGEIRGGGNDTFEVPVLTDSVGIFSAGPGSTDLVMPDGIGLRVPQSSLLALEVHYFNSFDTTEEDRTGVELCVTTKKRPIEAASHQLGKVNFQLPAHQHTDVTSVCRPRMQRGDIHLLAVTPHMHLTGRRYQLILNRVSGESLTLFDRAYAFQEQRWYDLPVDGSGPDVVMKPGDTLTSICSYENDSDAIVAAGTRTQDEMCQPQVVAWPAGSLSNGLLPTALVASSVVGCVEL